MIAERAGEDAYENLIRKKVLNRLKLRHTYVPTTPEFPEAHADGYEQQSDGSYLNVTNAEPTAPWAAGSMISNIFDLADWIEAFVDGALISPEMHAQQLDFKPITPAAGCGLGILRKTDGLMGHDGSFRGFFSEAWRVGNYTVVALANSRSANNVADQASAAVAEMILSGETE